MNSKGTHKKTGLYKTEVLGTRKYSNQPRGCSCAYMIHYMSRFSPHDAYMQWELFKKHMMKKVFGRVAFREFLPEYKGKWSPDSGPIIAGCGVAATGLGLNASSSVGDSKTFRGLEKSMNPFISLFNGTESFVGNNFITKIGTDLLASSIWLNAETKEKLSIVEYFKDFELFKKIIKKENSDISIFEFGSGNGDWAYEAKKLNFSVEII